MTIISPIENSSSVHEAEVETPLFPQGIRSRSLTANASPKTVILPDNLGVIVYIALGSNLGDRPGYLRRAIAGLAEQGIELVRSSSLYLTEPKELLDQPWFLNCAVEAATELAPLDLLEVCLDVERQNDRVRTVSNAPRTLDVDIIFYGNQILELPALTIPHPRYANRRFVLEPLAEIAPTFRDPVLMKTTSELLATCTDTAVVRKAGPPLFQ